MEEGGNPGEIVISPEAAVRKSTPKRTAKGNLLVIIFTIVNISLKCNFTRPCHIAFNSLLLSFTSQKYFYLDWMFSAVVL